MSNLLKNLLIALGLAVILFLGYFLFFRSDGTGDESFVSDSLSPVAELETLQLLAMLNELKTYKVDDSIFSSRIFESLRDFRTDLGTEPEGRTNPFAPIR